MNNDSYIPPSEQRLLSRFWQSARGYWGGATAPWAWLLTVLLIATVLLQLLTQYTLNFWNRDFFNAVERKDGAELLTQAWRFLPLAAASLALAVFSVWGRMTLQRKWRAWLSNHLYKYWLERDHYVRLRFMPGEHQAPEYRIAEDARLATDLPVDLVLGLFSSLITGITFIGILWSVGGSSTIEMFGLTLTIPGYLVVAVIIYSVLVAAAMMLIGSRLTRVVEENKRAEAELRAIGTHIRESGEGKTLPDNIKDRLHSVSTALRAVIATWLEYCWPDSRHAQQHVAGPGCRSAALHAEIRCRHDAARRGGSGGRCLCRGAGCLQLVHRQLYSPGGLGRLRQPRRIPAAGAGSD
jgi:putative ATP-binding cassette transporter